jgi:hypothetical protein
MKDFHSMSQMIHSIEWWFSPHRIGGRHQPKLNLNCHDIGDESTVVPVESYLWRNLLHRISRIFLLLYSFLPSRKIPCNIVCSFLHSHHGIRELLQYSSMVCLDAMKSRDLPIWQGARFYEDCVHEICLINYEYLVSSISRQRRMRIPLKPTSSFVNLLRTKNGKYLKQ